jgi:hypothetical protein
MTRIGSCIACQHGDHKRHQRVIQSVPEGMLGGAVCGCEGECQGKSESYIPRQADLINRAMRKVRRDAA